MLSIAQKIAFVVEMYLFGSKILKKYLKDFMFQNQYDLLSASSKLLKEQGVKPYSYDKFTR
jgi:hypothetical protein